MSAEITLFNQLGELPTQTLMDPFAMQTATFVAPRNCVARIYAKGADVAVTLKGQTWTVPSGMVERIGIRSGDTMTIA